MAASVLLQRTRRSHKIAAVFTLLALFLVYFYHEEWTVTSIRQFVEEHHPPPPHGFHEHHDPPPPPPPPSHKPAAPGVVKVETEPFKYSFKPIAYIFPQFHAIPENDKIWGEGFTEWDNVRKVTNNTHGLETIRPHESVGYYNGTDFSTRQRQGQYVKDSGFYGVAFHHYWFAGKPVMDKVIRLMLEDGEPDVPFMLSWANEPWIPRWAGADPSKPFIDQDYGGVEDWRKHFDWLLPFFKHPKYIRNDGNLQFLVYLPTHIGQLGPYMFAAWRQWAIEEGLGGLDIIETRWGGGPSNWNNYPADAINEFAPQTSGFDHSRHPLTMRTSRVYHKGTLVCWDTTPRHSTEKHLGNPQPLCHPKTWENYMVELLYRVKMDPNPIGKDNYVFVNALNEWGEGNAFEPSVQFGDAYGKAMKSALATSEKLHQWPDIIREEAMTRNKLLAANPDPVDVCVLIRTFDGNTDWNTFKLRDTLSSLQGLNNQKWRALVFDTQYQAQGKDKPSASIQEAVDRVMDSRIKVVKIAPYANSTWSQEDVGANATDYIIGNLAHFNHSCETARYLHLTTGFARYHPTAFDIIDDQDILVLNVETKETVWKALEEEKEEGEEKWDDRCDRIRAAEQAGHLCNAKHPDLSSTFFNLPRFLSEGHTLLSTNSNGTTSIPLINTLVQSHAWSHTPDPHSGKCHVQLAPSFTSCTETGNFWLDTPYYKNFNCYTTSELESFLGFKDHQWDLEGYRKSELGGCLRYKEENFEIEVEKVRNGTYDEL